MLEGNTLSSWGSPGLPFPFEGNDPRVHALRAGVISATSFPSWRSLAESLHLSVPQLSQPIGTKKERKEVEPFVLPSPS